MTWAAVIALSLGLAHAEEPRPAREALEPGSLVALQQQIADGAKAARLLEAGAVLLDERADVGSRLEAATTLGRSGDPRALVFLRAGVRDPAEAVRQAAVLGSLELGGADAVPVVLQIVRDRAREPEEQLAVLERLAGLELPAVDEALGALSADGSLRGAVRRRARRLAEARAGEATPGA